jgi:hypothetical protein
MNLAQIMQMLSGTRNNGVAPVSAVEGFVPANLPKLQMQFSSPEVFVPGFSSGGAIHAKKRKRKKKYNSDLERDAHDILVNNHYAKRQKLRGEAKGQDMESFLRNVHTGVKRPIQDVYDVTSLRKGLTPAAKRAREAPAEEEKTVLQEEKTAYQPDVTPEEEEVQAGMALTDEEKAIMQSPEPPAAITEEEAKIAEPAEVAPTPMPDVRQPSAEAALGTLRQTGEVQELSKMFEQEEPPMVGPTPEPEQEHEPEPMEAERPPEPAPRGFKETFLPGEARAGRARARQEALRATRAEERQAFREGEMEEEPPELTAPEMPVEQPAAIPPVQTEVPSAARQGVLQGAQEEQKTAEEHANIDRFVGLHGAPAYEQHLRDVLQEPSDEIARFRDHMSTQHEREQRAAAAPAPGAPPAAAQVPQDRASALERFRALAGYTADEKEGEEPTPITSTVPPRTEARERDVQRFRTLAGYEDEKEDTSSGPAPVVSRPPSTQQRRQTGRLLEAGLDAIRRRGTDLGLDLEKLGKRLGKKVTRIKDPRKTKPGPPPAGPDDPIKPPTKPKGISAVSKDPPAKPQAIRFKKKKLPPLPPDEPMLERAEKAVSFPVKRKVRKLQKKESAVSFPGPPGPPEPPAEPKKEKPVKRRVSFKEPAREKGSAVKTAQQSTVNVTPTMQSSSTGLGSLAGKIDQLINAAKQTKRKGKQKSALAAAKKSYRAYRKRALANVKVSNKAIRKRETERIKKLPVKQRKEAKKRLKEALKKRENAVKAKLPSKISTAGQLSSLMQDFKVLKV